MEDQRIIALYWDRDQNAIDETALQYGKTLTGIAYSLLQNRQDAEECVNDTYMQAWNAIPPARPQHLLRYLGCITRNLALKRYRHYHAQKRGPSLALEELEDCIPASTSVERMCDGRRLTAVIDGWLETLPRQERILFVRRYWYGDSLESLAISFHTTPNRLAGKLFRLRQKLKSTLEKEDCL